LKKKYFLSFILFSLIFTIHGEGTVSEESVDSKNRLRLMTYEDEFFVPEEKKENTVLINKAGRNAIRTYYDEQSRVSKKETWEITDARNSRMVTVEFYEYEGNTDRIIKTTLMTDTSEEVTAFNEKGFPVVSEVFYFKDGEVKDNDEVEKIKYLFSKKSVSYDDKDRVVSETVTLEKKSQSKKYSYHEDSDIPADFESYENNRLQRKVMFVSADTYSEEVYFDSSYSVKSYFEEGKRIKDEYFQKGKLLRTKVYE